MAMAAGEKEGTGKSAGLGYGVLDETRGPSRWLETPQTMLPGSATSRTARFLLRSPGFIRRLSRPAPLLATPMF